MLTPNLLIGGASVSLYNLIRFSDPARVNFTGIAVVHDSPDQKAFEDLVPDLPIHVMHGDKGIGSKALSKATDGADLLMAWGPCEYPKHMSRIDIPLVITCRGGIGCQYTRKWVDEALPFASYYTAVSEDALWHFPDQLKGQVAVIPNTYDTSRLAENQGREAQRKEWGIDSEQKVVGYLGRCCPSKSIDLCVDAASMLPDEWVFVLAVPDVSLEAAYREKIKQALEEKMPGRYRIVHPGYQVGDALRSFDVSLNLSSSEGCGNRLIESWYVGTPLVTTPVGIANQMAKTFTVGAFVDPHGDPNVTATEIAGHILILDQQPKDAIDGGREAAEMLSVENHVRQWADFLEDCLEDAK